ncbi:MAG: DUF2231 domain-containing protein [Chloroflexi bacterium]|nr:DUF2231 domain-containing protein [Chloroflexota bacterium]MCI0576793.1 DUF2231 domain-containing protein [Chloroflexota bacterium]MCI0648372.1 DUF2231 domain-containing protein [Chloroflexota bacterium]MCI0731680.1 DUF2231 domain-containing protein [Chloroflexota bacterium]
MKEFLQGKWFKHPLHPMLVHLPTALWTAAFVFDLLTQFGIGGNPLVRTSFYAIGLGLLVTLLAIPTGLADWLDIKPGKPARNLGLYHLALNATATVVWATNFFLRLGALEDSAVRPTPFVWLSALGTILLFVAGYLGGRMVYAYGISVARHSKEKWRRIAQEGGANLPPR